MASQIDGASNIEGPVGEVDQDDQIKEQTTLGGNTVGANMDAIDA